MFDDSVPDHEAWMRLRGLYCLSSIAFGMRLRLPFVHVIVNLQRIVK